MEPVLEGVKVVELAEWAFVPSAGATLADWGADVIKIEHPVRGDSIRGLMLPGGVADFNHMVEQMNRGKRGLGLDISKPAGREILLKLVADADVFLTSMLEWARQKYKIAWEDLSAVNPRLIYARGSGQGPRGPDAGKPGFDGHTWWSQGGVTYMLSPGEEPGVSSRPAFGDVISGQFLAGGIAAALFRRTVTSRGIVVDVSLLNSATWILAPDLTSSWVSQQNPVKAGGGGGGTLVPNPLMGSHKTSDARYITLMMLQADRYWPGFCRALGREDLIDDPRYSDMALRAQNGVELVGIIREIFASTPMTEMLERLDREDCIAAAMQKPLEVAQDRQVLANGYFPQHPRDPRARLSASPVQFDEGQVEFKSGAPEMGQDTELILQELGYDWDALSQLKKQQVIN